MHIPDGYLSPETCAAGVAAMVPAWAVAGRRVRRTVKTASAPLLAIAAAYSFLVMLLNVPVPDGTTAHAVGAVLIAVVLGPWAAVIAVSTALAIQALLFGDGGVLAYGVNCFNMALVMPAVGYFLVYKPLTRRVGLTSPKRALAAGLGGYAGISAAALCCGLELGLQPDLFHGAHGQPLYAPYHVSQAVPAMLLAHLTVAGAVEFALTLGVIAYLQRANLPVLRINHAGVATNDDRRPEGVPWRFAVAPIVLVAFATPLGLVDNAGAFGETNVRSGAVAFLRKNHLSAIPWGMNRYAGFWHHALFNGYDFRHDAHPAVGYVISAVVGAAAISVAVLAVLAAARVVQRRGRRPTVGASP